MNKILFAIYTNHGNHQVFAFDTFSKDGKSAFDQAIEYATTHYNDPNDKPQLFLLSELPINWATVKRTPAEWEAIQEIEILDPDGWNDKSLLEPITEAEFNERVNESTIYPLNTKAKPVAGCCGYGGADCKCHCH